MRLDVAKYLFDVHSAATTLAGFVDGKCWEDYQADAMLRAAVERQFEIIGRPWRSCVARTKQYSQASTTIARSSRSGTC